MMEPARSIIQKFGGAYAVARIAGVHPTRVYGWMKSRERGGTGGHVPDSHIRTLLRHARENGIPLEPAEFYPDETTLQPSQDADEQERAAS